MKKRISVIAVLVLLMVFAACKGTNKISGTYALTEFYVNGWNMASDAEGSYFDVYQYSDNLIATMFFYFPTETTVISDMVVGVLSPVEQTEDSIKYKFWIQSHSGGFFDDNAEWFYVYYDVESDIVQFKATHDVLFTFSK